MDYEFRILLLEKELFHAKEMQALMRERLDTHDTSFGHIRDALMGAAERFERIESILESLARNVDTMATKVDTMAAKVDALVQALLRQHPNGGE